MKKFSLLRIISASVVCINILLIAIKIWIYKQTDSISVFASLMDSVFDILISSINALVLFYAEKPRDDDHRFGHQAIEDVISLFQIFLIALATIWVFINAISTNSRTYHFDWLSFGVTVFSIIPTIIIISLQMYAVRKKESTIMKADLLHYSGDVLTTIGVIFAMLSSHYFKVRFIDSIVGIIIMIIILKSCFHGAKKAFDNLMAKELNDGTREKIENILQNANNIFGFKNLKTRQSGHIKFAQVDIIFANNISLEEAHKIAHELEDKFHLEISNLEITIHLEPA